jgi:hypothetical protein
MKAVVLVVVLAAALLVVPAAGAKGLSPLRVCGASGCTAIEADPFVIVYPVAVRPQPPTSPYYRIDYRNTGAPWDYFVPGRNVVGRVQPRLRRWFGVEQAASDAIRAAIRGLDPFPAPVSWDAPPDRPADASRSLATASLLIVLAGAMVAAGTFRRRQA